MMHHSRKAITLIPEWRNEIRSSGKWMKWGPTTKSEGVGPLNYAPIARGEKEVKRFSVTLCLDAQK
jgi:hypothetical protein